MTITTKGLAKSVLDSYSSSLSRLTAKYMASISGIDSEYDMKKKEIEKGAHKKKNSADASAKIALHNTKAGLLERGLSKSGDSVQAELDNNLQRMNAISQIESDTEDSLRQNEQSRASAKSSALVKYLGEMNSLEQAKNTAYTSQLNRDRDYEAERDDEKYDRFADNRDYEARRDDEKYDRFADNRDYEAEREDEKYDRFADNRDYEAERNDEKYQRYVNSLKKEGEKEENATSYHGSEEDGNLITSAERITPNYNARTLVDQITDNYHQKYGYGEKSRNTIYDAIKTIVQDSSLDYSYRYQVKLYAKALGYY